MSVNCMPHATTVKSWIQCSLWSVWRFDTNSSSEIAQKIRSRQVKFAIEQERTFWVNILRFLSQVREIIYTSKELTCIEATCIETTLYRKTQLAG